MQRAWSRGVEMCSEIENLKEQQESSNAQHEWEKGIEPHPNCCSPRFYGTSPVS